MSYEFITQEKKGRVGLVTLNRPKQLNALNAKLMQELGQALHAFDADPDVGAIHISGIRSPPRGWRRGFTRKACTSPKGVYSVSSSSTS